MDTLVEKLFSVIYPIFGGPNYTARWLPWRNVAISAIQQVKTLNIYCNKLRNSKIGKTARRNSIKLCGALQNAQHEKRYLLVTVDNFSLWVDVLFLHKPTTKKVIEFFKKYTSQYGLPKTKSIRSRLSFY